MKTVLLAMTMTLITTQSLAATGLFCSWMETANAPCETVYDLFVADQRCYTGQPQAAIELLKTGLKEDVDLTLIDALVANSNSILVFLSDSGVEQALYINKCAQ